MAYNSVLAVRIRKVLLGNNAISEKKMFGGIAFLLNGNIAVGVSGDDLMVRVGAESYEGALAQPHTAVFDMTGRPMSGWILVKPQGTTTDEQLITWVEKGVSYARSLPPK